MDLSCRDEFDEDDVPKKSMDKAKFTLYGDTIRFPLTALGLSVLYKSKENSK